MSNIISQNDYNIFNQRVIEKYIRIELLDFSYNILDDITGNVIDLSVNINANSDIRRTCSCQLAVNDSTFDIQAGGKIWLNRYIRPYIGYKNILTNEIQWYNQGIFLINAPSWNYNATTNTLSFEGIDLMSKLTGLRNGNLEGIPTIIKQGESVRDAIIDTIKLGGFTQYVVSECTDTSGNIQTVPYDIQIDVGGTLFDILKELRDILPQYQIYFDIDGVFHYDLIPSGNNAPVLYSNEFLNNIVIDESINTDFESVKNVVEVIGRLLNPAYYGSGTVTSGEILLNIPDLFYLNTINTYTMIGFSVPNNINVPVSIHIVATTSTGTKDFGTAPLVDSNNVAVSELNANTYYVMSRTPSGDWFFMGTQQIRATAMDENPDSPFYVNSDIGRIRIVLSGGEYDNIYSLPLAQQRANWELWKRTRLNDSITLSMFPVPFMDVNTLIEYGLRNSATLDKYIIKSISVSYSDNGTATINAIKYYPYYMDNDV